MRRNTGWGALLLAAGVALAPTGARAQTGADGPPAPFILPQAAPTFRGLTDVDGSITGDLNGTQVNTDTQPPFIIRGPIVPGNFLGTGTPALYTDDVKGQESYQPGYRITLGYRFDNGTAI